MATSTMFKKRMNEIIEDSGFKNIAEFAKSLNVSRSTLNSAKNYGIVFTVKTFIAIADYLDKPFEYVLGKTNDENFIKSDVQESFYDRLEILLQRDKIKFYSLAINHLGIDQSSFSNWKIKKIYPNCETLLSMSKHFKCSIDYLLGRTDFEDVYSENNGFDIDFN